LSGQAEIQGRCGVIQVLFQCAGLDGKPAWAIRVIFTDGTGGIVFLPQTDNYDASNQNERTDSRPNGMYADAVSYGTQTFPTFAATCGTAPAPPPPVPPTPTPTQQPTPAPPEEPSPGAQCQPVPVACGDKQALQPGCP